MGFNTAVLVLNDALDQIAQDPNFGKKLADAIQRQHSRDVPIDVTAGYHGNAATVIKCSHADYANVIAFGGNHATVLLEGYGIHHTPESQLDLLRQMADKYGMKLIKKPTK